MSQVPRDVQEFLDGYPDVRDDPSQTENLEFYQNKRRCQPDKLLIDQIHQEWQDEYDILEDGHGYIQWLFPIREYGMNYDSQPLQVHEIAAMTADKNIMLRLERSYELMLSFYGMRLLDSRTGLLARTPEEDQRIKQGKRQGSRYHNLRSRPHNNLRISRIFKCLSEMGLEHLNAGFLLHVLCEQSSEKQLNDRFLISSMDRWWANCIRNTEERKFISRLITLVRKGERFDRAMYENLLDIRLTHGKFHFEAPNVQASEANSVGDAIQKATHEGDGPAVATSEETPLIANPPSNAVRAEPTSDVTDKTEVTP